MSNFLFLQGNATPFFLELSRALTLAGHHVQQIAFNGGDWLFSPKPICFRGRTKNWLRFFDRIVKQNKPDAVILFGDCRPMHRSAINYLQEHGIDIWVFEEGYLRPGWITLEREGVNGFSLLPSNPDTIMALAPKEHKHLHYNPRPDFKRRAIYDVTYHVARMLLMPVFPFSRFHALVGPFREYAGWVQDWLFSHKKNGPRILPTCNFMLLPMQMEGDYQLRMHSSFNGMAQVLETVLRSFATSAPRDMALVIRRHPLDPRLVNWNALITKYSIDLGIQDRVFYMYEGPLDDVLHSCSGIITVNSTVGLLALRTGKPVKTLGHAIYDIPDLTFQGDLNQFWHQAHPPNTQILDAFCRLLEHSVLIEGDFFTPVGRQLAVQGAVARITSEYQTSSDVILSQQDLSLSTVSSN